MTETNNPTYKLPLCCLSKEDKDRISMDLANDIDNTLDIIHTVTGNVQYDSSTPRVFPSQVYLESDPLGYKKSVIQMENEPINDYGVRLSSVQEVNDQHNYLLKNKNSNGNIYQSNMENRMQGALGRTVMDTIVLTGVFYIWNSNREDSRLMYSFKEGLVGGVAVNLSEIIGLRDIIPPAKNWWSKTTPPSPGS